MSKNRDELWALKPVGSYSSSAIVMLSLRKDASDVYSGISVKMRMGEIIWLHDLYKNVFRGWSAGVHSLNGWYHTHETSAAVKHY